MVSLVLFGARVGTRPCYLKAHMLSGRSLRQAQGRLWANTFRPYGDVVVAIRAGVLYYSDQWHAHQTGFTRGMRVLHAFFLASRAFR